MMLELGLKDEYGVGERAREGSELKRKDASWSSRDIGCGFYLGEILCGQ